MTHVTIFKPICYPSTDGFRIRRETNPRFGRCRGACGRELARPAPSSSSPAFLERYLRTEICVCLEVRCRFGETESDKLYAVFSHPMGAGFARDFGADRFAAERRHNANYINASNRAGNDEKGVFIKDIILVDDVKERIVRRGSIVRLYRPDDLLGRPRHASYQSAVTGAFECFRCLADGKLFAVGGRSSIFDDQSVDKVIKARPQMMDNLSGQDAEARRHRNGGISYERMLAPIVLMLSNNFISLGLPRTKAWTSRLARFSMFSSARCSFARQPARRSVMVCQSAAVRLSW